MLTKPFYYPQHKILGRIVYTSPCPDLIPKKEPYLHQPLHDRMDQDTSM